MNEYLNPKSMLTPGLSGAAIMAIAGALWVNFAIPQKWTALALSFLVCSVVFTKLADASLDGVPLLGRTVLYLLNSLVIFAVATGSNMGLAAATGGGEAPPPRPAPMAEAPQDAPPAPMSEAPQVARPDEQRQRDMALPARQAAIEAAARRDAVVGTAKAPAPVSPGAPDPRATAAEKARLAASMAALRHAQDAAMAAQITQAASPPPRRFTDRWF